MIKFILKKPNVRKAAAKLKPLHKIEGVSNPQFVLYDGGGVMFAEYDFDGEKEYYLIDMDDIDDVKKDPDTALRDFAKLYFAQDEDKLADKLEQLHNYGLLDIRTWKQPTKKIGFEFDNTGRAQIVRLRETIFTTEEAEMLIEDVQRIDNIFSGEVIRWQA